MWRRRTEGRSGPGAGPPARVQPQRAGAYGCLTVLTPILGLLILLQAVQAADGTDRALWVGLFVVIGLSYWPIWEVKFHRRLRRDCLEELARGTA